MLKKIFSSLVGLPKKKKISEKVATYKKRKIDSDLAIDQDGYKDVIDHKLANKEINIEDYQALLDFHLNGFCVLDLSNELELIDQLDSEIESIWRTPPSDLLGSSQSATKGKLCPLSEIVEINNSDLRRPGFRLIDIQSHSHAARKLFLHNKIHSLIDKIIEQECIAIQSLYFEHGSTQALHRDPWFVVTKPVKNLVACWIALEDIHIDSGPLSYVSGSHRLPFLFDEHDNIILHAPHVTAEYRNSVYEDMKLEVNKRGLEASKFTAKKGQVFVWHGTLVHGGSPVLNPELTRKSLVIHFDAKDDAPKKGARFTSNDEEQVVYSDEIYEQEGCYGYKNPIVN